MNLLKCILTENRCYTSAQVVAPCGVMVHSTGANNPTLRRYVQPSKDDPNYEQLMELLGKNRYDNDWNCPTPGGSKVCVHGFIGKLADDTVAAVQTLPWDIVGWHSGYASKRSTTNANKLGYIGFEICEDDLCDPNYFAEIYQTAVDLTAYLCRLYGFDPQGKNQYGYPFITCHREGFDLGIAYCHADVLHWFPKYGKSMDTFRADVAAAMENTEEEETEVRYQKLVDIPDKWNFRNIIDMLMTAGIIAGDGSDPDGNGDVIDLSYDMVRLIIFDYRAGVYDDAIRAAGLDPDVYK